jgi:predicted lysophospholipase L1 biosynthesis ABC-type transport system permease subunit
VTGPWEDAEERLKTLKVTRRAIRRLAVFEWVVLGAAVVAAVVGGALSALLMNDAFGLPFRPSWIAASILLFVVPGLFVWIRARS